MRKLSLFSILALCFWLGGCKDPYRASEQVAGTIAASITTGLQTTDALRLSGLITPAEEAQVDGYLKFAGDANGAFGACAQAAHMAGSKVGAYTSCASLFQTELLTPAELKLIYVENPSAQAKIKTITDGISTGITTLLTALGGA